MSFLYGPAGTWSADVTWDTPGQVVTLQPGYRTLGRIGEFIALPVTVETPTSTRLHACWQTPSISGGPTNGYQAMIRLTVSSGSVKLRVWPQT